jgi:hypothetical protein
MLLLVMEIIGVMMEKTLKNGNDSLFGWLLGLK